jgi:hypothetical protein
MAVSFQISALGFPCRVSLVDAEIGESVLLVNYEHLPAASPYRMRYARMESAAVRVAPRAAERNRNRAGR